MEKKEGTIWKRKKEEYGKRAIVSSFPFLLTPRPVTHLDKSGHQEQSTMGLIGRYCKKRHRGEETPLRGVCAVRTAQPMHKSLPNSNIKYEYSWVSKTLFKAIVFLSSYFPPADLLSGRALHNFLEIRTLIPLISASDSLSKAKTIPWKSFCREKSVTSRDAFSGNFRHKENAKNGFLFVFSSFTYFKQETYCQKKICTIC